ncbi:universal stress protein [Microbacterium sp. SD291]|uniref:universal stress protein n=1 Tax=Microbacterium sp. SD291 TaxID=2782007 RepID=UPI001A958035|nr:universal stress protein [Microbacterium sp. SD291]MBO0980628.1 universal stress protein [Microbacterium sp. SD291]
MERIVLGYDGGPAAVAALSWVIRRVNRRVARIDIVSVVPTHAVDRSSSLEHLEAAEARLRDQARGTRVGLHRLEGDVADGLAGVVDDADILVTGINLGRPVRAKLAGALPVRLSARADVPVVLVPSDWTETGDPVTVGIAADGSSDAALAFAAAEAEILDVPTRLVHSWLMPTPRFAEPHAVQPTPESVAEGHSRVLDRASVWVLGHYPRAAVCTELVRDVASGALLSYADRSSMLVMGTRRLGPLAGSLFGSVTQEVLWRAECPVAIVPSSSRPRRPRIGSA